MADTVPPKDTAISEGLDVRTEVALAPLTTMGIGGPARFYLEVQDIDQLRAALRWSREASIPVFVLGGGSNVLISDDGFPGLVLSIAMRGLEFRQDGGSVIVRAAAGEDWDEFTARVVEQNLAGVECLSGIPGKVGASPMQNIGAYGQEVCDTITTVEALDVDTGDMHTFSASECEFGYRTSRFKTRDKGRFVITSVSFRLVPGGSPAIKYADLVRYFDGVDLAGVSLSEVRYAVLAIRRRKSMVADPADINSHSCGSFFTNPIIHRDQLATAEQKARAAGRIGPEEPVPAYDCGNERVKVSAAWLISHAGCERGMRHGNVGLSEKHVLAIVNYGNGTMREVLELAEQVQARVMEAFGIHLEPEPVFLR